MSKGDDKSKLVEEIQQDISLKYCKKLASMKEWGYKFEDGLLIHTLVDVVGGEIKRIVLPTCRRNVVLKLAHDHCGHVGYRKVLDIINKRFTWPNISPDVYKYCQSCSTCQKSNKRGHIKAPMLRNHLKLLPWILWDLYHLERVNCVISLLLFAWPQGGLMWYPLRPSRLDALVGIFGRTGLPLQIISDNGTQFTSKLVSELSNLFSIDLARTTPYHPQAKGVIERMHATLESMLRKAHTQGLDWVGQIPFALFALRQMPSRTTGFSPYELVYGRHIRTPLDVLYAGWKAKDFEKLNACEWTCQLAHRLECLRDVAALRSKNKSQKRKEGYDKGKSDRKLEIGGS